jgi:DNA-directed RNA polymerase subunit RPC12/RpoP
VTNRNCGDIIVKYLLFKGSDKITLIGKTCYKCGGENTFWKMDKFDVPEYMVCKECGFHHKIIGFERFGDKGE